MKTIFDAKSEEDNVSELGIFESMKKRVESLLETCKAQTYTQVVVVLTSNHNLYGMVI